jgi:UDP-N-acetylglucosamine 4,6-dehydratase/UDP-glucose 4-epimerase
MEFAFFVSTDKAYTLNGNYSITKFLMEQLVKEYQNINTDTQYNIIRLGNILYSTGSVLCKWKDDLLNNKDIKLTHPDAFRFFIHKEKAIDEILFQLKTNIFEYTPRIKGVKMGVLAKLMIQKYNKNQKYKIIGLQPGENLNEKIDFDFIPDEYSEEELIKLI